MIDLAVSVARNLHGYVLATREFAIVGMPADVQNTILMFAAVGVCHRKFQFASDLKFIRAVIAAMRVTDTVEYKISKRADNSLKRGNFLKRIFK